MVFEGGFKDQVGTITDIMGHWGPYDGTVSYGRVYDTFGNTISATGTKRGNLGFQSKYQDQETGLYYFYNRYYSPSIGRFINEDPVRFRGGLNFYLFTSGNPINFIDPFGLLEVIIEVYRN